LSGVDGEQRHSVARPPAGPASLAAAAKALNAARPPLTQRPKALDVRAFWDAERRHFRVADSLMHATLLLKKDVIPMRTIDFAPLYRSVVGFDRLASLLEAATTEAASGYPPYNIERTDENAYRIEMAVAGFKPEELNIEVKENLLTVQGRKAANDDARRYLHRGLAERNFERRFQLADYVVVTEARLADGLLSIALKREIPEALKPRRIEIAAGEQAPLIEGEKAA
jgi:molecular chaperone IbpA